MKFTDYLKERFGIALNVKVVEGKNKAFVMSQELEKKGIYAGLLAGKRSKFGWKPTSDFVQLMGKLARKNVVEISREEAEKIFRGESIERKELEEGYVILKIKGFNVYVGCGLYLHGKIISQIPKYKRL
jgi:NOL1/NOP2/fmu family ribosome biogenesis protein